MEGELMFGAWAISVIGIVFMVLYMIIKDYKEEEEEEEEEEVIVKAKTTTTHTVHHPMNLRSRNKKI